MEKKGLRDALPGFVIRHVGNLTVGAWRKAMRLLKRAEDARRKLAHHGLFLESELPPPFSNLLRLAQGGGGNLIPPFGVHDFLLLSEAEKTSSAVIPSAAAARAVEISIIIPVFNKAEFTFQCLRSLFAEIDAAKTEIIVVDNASRDETQKMLDAFGGRLRVIRNEENRGFVEACNQGAAAARGEFLVFLNNDTIVQKNWLNALRETFDRIEGVGAVGSMLVYPDGQMQEAGGIVWRDGTARLYGSRENPRDWRFNFAREVDYCSGASLMIRKDLFERLGRFDPRFAPAYYEDTDLCMSVRRVAGLKVIFQPASRVTHFEGATAGRDTQTGFKRFQEINRRKFVEKWRAVLEAEHFPPSPEKVFAASNRKKGPRVAVVSNHVPRPDKDSGSVRLTAILESLARLGRVTFVSIYHPSKNLEQAQKLGADGIEVAWSFDFERRLKSEKFDAVILSYPKPADFMFSAVRRRQPAAKIIYDTVDVHFLRLEREFQLTGRTEIAQEAAAFKKIETRLARRADEVWCVTAADREFLQPFAPQAKIEIVPNIHSLHNRGKAFAERSGLMFIGSFLHRPNRDAVFYFLDEIFPRVLEKIPDARFHIIGGDAPPEIFARNSENVRVEGFVPDAAPFFENCRVFVAPLRYGAGMKGKIGQALSYGLPTVTTAVGAEGMNLQNEREILLADDPAAFAEAVVRAYQTESLWQKLSDDGYRFIEENYSPRVIETKIAALLADGSGKLTR